MNRHFAAAIIFIIAFGCITAHAQEGETPKPQSGAATQATRLSQPKLVGSFEADGTYTEPTSGVPGPNGRSRIRYSGNRPEEVPPKFVALRERVIDDYEPPARAATPLHSQSLFATLIDRVISFVYGPGFAFEGPTHITTDSRGRLIVSDPDQVSVHVVAGRDSFRIQGGPGPRRRLQNPGGIAVDREDNIYVADAQRHLIFVYSAAGQYLRTLGKFGKETMFQEPTAIAIDRDAEKLYVLDTPVNELVTLDLKGNVLHRAGGLHGLGPVSFDLPTELAVANKRIAVLDCYGTRVHLLDAKYNEVGVFKVRNIVGRPVAREMGLALDSAGNVYVSGPNESGLKIYEPGGTVLATVVAVQWGDEPDVAAAGLWIDSFEDIYLADRANRRVKVFRR